MKPSAKVQVLNFFRRLFMIPVLENQLVRLTVGKPATHFFCKLVPNPYQYKRGSFRWIDRKGVRLKVDISDYVGHYIYFGFEDLGLKKLFSLCTKESYVLDVGANIGWTVLNLGRLASAGKVMGFEPDPLNHDRCQQNLNDNIIDNVKLFPVGLGDRAARLKMEVPTPSNLGGNRIAPAGSEGSREVEIVRLDDFAPVLEWPRIDLIKIDVEGYDLKVLRGAETLLKKYHPILFVELDDQHLRDQGDSASALISFLQQVGYSRIEHAETNQPVLPSDSFTGEHFDIVARA